MGRLDAVLSVRPEWFERKWRPKAEIIPIRRKQMLTPLQIVSIIALRLEGETWNQLAKEYDYTSGQKLRRHVREALFPKAKGHAYRT